MVITPHAVTGALLGSLCPNPATAFAVGVCSHLALDAIPHFDYSIAGRDGLAKMSFDTTVAASLISSATQDSSVSTTQLLAGAAGGVALDLALVAENRFGTRITLPLHQRCHTGRSVGTIVGWATQAVVAGLAWVLLRRHAADHT